MGSHKTVTQDGRNIRQSGDRTWNTVIAIYTWRCIELFDIIKSKFNVFTLWGVASTDLLGVLSVRRAKRRFSFASSMVGGFGVLVVFPVVMGLGCIISSIYINIFIYILFIYGFFLFFVGCFEDHFIIWVTHWSVRHAMSIMKFICGCNTAWSVVTTSIR